MTEHVGMALSHARLRENLHHQASRDPLTRLANRRHLEVVLEREVGRSRRRKSALSLMLIDVDHFKRFIDDCGHDAGDLVLKHVGATLGAAVRAGDIVGRYGGEEFLIVMPETDLEAARTRAELARSAVARLRLQFGDTVLPAVTISIGVASFPSNGDSVAALLRASDVALYAAKHDGRDRVAAARPASLIAV